MRRSWILAILIGVSFLIWMALETRSDTPDLRNIQDNAEVSAGELDSANSLGQTFISHSPRLHAIQVRWIVSQDVNEARSLASSEGSVTLHLRRHPQDARDLASASIPVRAIQPDGYTAFDFPPLQDSQDGSYYFSIDVSAAQVPRGTLSLWASEGDDYPDGELYVNGRPAPRDLVFRTYDEPDLGMLLGEWREMLARDGWGILGAVCVFIFSGGLLTRGILSGDVLLIAPGTSRDHWIESLALASGVGLAVLSAISVLWLWLGPFDQAAFWLALIGLVLSGGRLWRGRLWRGSLWRGSLWFSRRRARVLGETRPGTATGQDREHSAASPSHPERLAFGVLALLTLLAVSVDLVQIHDVSVPLWVDSVSHAGYIAHLLDVGRLPADNFYHLGYHATVALVMRVTGISLAQGMLIVGQLLIVQAGLSVFLLTRRLTQGATPAPSASALAGLTAAVCVWFLSPTPSYFVTWGRYPLLLGAAILPLALWAAVVLTDEPSWSSLLLAAVTLAGLAFAQIRLTAFYLVFVLLYAAYAASRDRASGTRGEGWRRLGGIGVLIASGALFGGIWLAGLALRGVTGSAILAENAAAPTIDVETALAVLRSHLGTGFWVIALVGLVAGLVRRSRTAWMATAWYAILMLLSVVSASVAGGLVPTSLVLLMAFIPAGLVIGDNVAALFTRTKESEGHAPTWAYAAACLALGGIALVAARNMTTIINPATVLYSTADDEAMQFIRDEIPAHSVFLTNSFAWFGSNYVPADGGGWIPYLTEDRILYPSGELIPDSSGVLQGNVLAEWIKAQGIQYVYLGTRAGVLTKSDFSSHPERYERVYDRGGVQLYRVE